MKVVDHEPQLWFLFDDAGQFVFNVNCQHSFIGYDFTIVLSDDEAMQYKAEGRVFLNRLAEEINYSAPIALSSRSKYKSRGVQGPIESSMSEAVRAWRDAGEGPAA